MVDVVREGSIARGTSNPPVLGVDGHDACHDNQENPDSLSQKGSREPTETSALDLGSRTAGVCRSNARSLGALALVFRNHDVGHFHGDRLARHGVRHRRSDCGEGITRILLEKAHFERD